MKMVETIKEQIRHYLFKGEYRVVFDRVFKLQEREKELDVREKNIQTEVNSRVAQAVLTLDPFELVMREYHGVFGEDFTHPEDRLNQQGIVQLRTLGFTLADDPSFNFLCEWIMNSQGNETLLKAPVTVERTLYGRAQISAVLAFRKEVRRLSEAYRDMLVQREGEDYESSLSTE